MRRCLYLASLLVLSCSTHHYANAPQLDANREPANANPPLIPPRGLHGNTNLVSKAVAKTQLHGKADSHKGVVARQVIPSEWVGTWKANDGFELKIDEQGNFTAEVLYQVGSEDDKEVPYPTVCHYRMTGTLAVQSIDASEQNYYKANKYPKMPDHKFTQLVKHYELLPDAENTKGVCQIFIARRNEGIKRRGPDQFSIHFKTLTATSFIDAWYENTYQKESPPTRSTRP